MNWKPFNLKEIKVGRAVSLEVKLADKRRGCISYEGTVEEFKNGFISLILAEDGESFLVDVKRIKRVKTFN